MSKKNRRKWKNNNKNNNSTSPQREPKVDDTSDEILDENTEIADTYTDDMANDVDEKTSNENVIDDNNETPSEENIVEENEIPSEENVVEENEVLSEDNVANENEIPSEENVVEENEVPSEENVANENEVPSEENVIDDNNETPSEENVADENEVPSDNISEETTDDKPLTKKELKKKAKEDKKKAKADAKANKKKMKKSSKIAIIVTTIILTIAIITTAIVVPIAIANKDKIFVSSAEDFKNTDGKYFVLKDDILLDGDLALGNLNNIDFNGKTLTINGKLSIDNTSNNKVILGNIDKKKGGTLQATDIVIKSKTAVEISSVIKTSTINVNAKTFKLTEGINIKDTANIKAEEVVIDARVEFADKNKANVLNIIDANKLNINKPLLGNLNIENKREAGEQPYLTDALIKGDVSGSILADSKTSLSINSKITKAIDTNEKELVGDAMVVNAKIGKVKLYENSFVLDVFNAENVFIHKDAVMPNMINITNPVQIIRPLERVAFATINDDTDTIFLDFAKVTEADNYIIKIDGVKVAETNENHVDITKYVRDVKKHTISIVAISKANAELRLASQPLTLEYTTYVTLKKPAVTSVTKDSATNKVTLKFEKVSFADEYIISVNGKKITTNKTEVDITDKIDHGGSYVIEIVATSKNDNILPSEPSLYQWSNEVKLDKPTLTITNKNVSTSEIKWDKIANAKYYEIVRVETVGAGTEGAQVVETVIFRTSANSLNIDVINNPYGIKKGQSFKIRAISASPYYTMSESNVVLFD